jgi:hypothetical protein
MSSNDDNLACARLRVTTRALMASLGVDVLADFVVVLERADGAQVTIMVATIARVRELVTELRPEHVDVCATQKEEASALRAYLTNAYTVARLH